MRLLRGALFVWVVIALGYSRRFGQDFLLWYGGLMGAGSVVFMVIAWLIRRRRKSRSAGANP